MEDKSILKKIKKEKLPEIIVDFSNNKNGEMKINLNYNKKLSLERKKIEKQYHPYFCLKYRKNFLRCNFFLKSSSLFPR